MIIKVFNNKDKQQSSHSFRQNQIILGRNPKVQNSVLIDASSVSRSHVKVSLKNQKLRIEDLSSSNGTFVNGEQIAKNQKVCIKMDDRIKLGQFQGYITVQRRDSQIKKSSSSQQSSEQQERERSRESKPRKKPAQVQIAQSTLKMLRSMTADKKSKAQRIRFLKLMGYSQAQQCWDEIQQLIKIKKTYFLSNANKKASEQLQKQFSLSRSGHQKRGLGR